MPDVAQPFRGKITFIDNGGNITIRTFDLIGSDFVDCSDALVAIVESFDYVSDALVIEYEISRRVTLAGFAYPASGVQIENLAAFNVRLAETASDTSPLIGKNITLTVPAPKPSIFLSTSGDGANIVNLGNSDVGVFFTAIRANAKFNGLIVFDFADGKRIHRGSRKG